MTLSVEVETGRRERTLVLPLAALRGAVADDRATVLVAHDGRVQERSVRLGLRTLDAAEVLDGLSAGEAVLLSRTLRPGARVQPQAVAWQPGTSALPGARAEDAGSAMTNAMGR